MTTFCAIVKYNRCDLCESCIFRAFAKEIKAIRPEADDDDIRSQYLLVASGVTDSRVVGESLCAWEAINEK